MTGQIRPQRWERSRCSQKCILSGIVIGSLNPRFKLERDVIPGRAESSHPCDFVGSLALTVRVECVNEPLSLLHEHDNKAPKQNLYYQPVSFAGHLPVVKSKRSEVRASVRQQTVEVERPGLFLDTSTHSARYCTAPPQRPRGTTACGLAPSIGDIAASSCDRLARLGAGDCAPGLLAWWWCWKIQLSRHAR